MTDRHSTAAIHRPSRHLVRAAKGFFDSATALGDAIGVRERTVYHWIEGKTEPRDGVWPDLRAALLRRREELDRLLADIPGEG